MSRHRQGSRWRRLREAIADKLILIAAIVVILFALVVGGSVIYVRYIEGGSQQLGDDCTLDRECATGKCVHHPHGRSVCEHADWGTH